MGKSPEKQIQLLLDFSGSMGVRGEPGGGGGVGIRCLFEAGRVLTFSAFRTSAYSRWALIFEVGRLFE